MKVLYSQLKKYLPDLTADAREVANVFTLTGFMLDKFIEVDFNGSKDYFLDLEVRQNRADSFGVWGLARELSAYYKIPLKLAEFKVDYPSVNYQLPINIKDKEAVKRLMAVKFEGLEIKESPTWLKEYLALYDINSINNLVDLTNYVLIETAHASHVFDADLVGDALTWELNNNKYSKINTLNGQEVELTPDTLVISDNKRPLSLSFIGGQEDAVSNNTKNVILEMAVYNGTIVRKNARVLKIMTEAGSRLEKFLDPESLPQAFDWLVSLILENCGGSIVSRVFSEYPQPTSNNEIRVNLDKVQQVAGIPITYTESKEYLKNLGFTIKEDNNNIVIVTRPVNRLDIEIEQDVFEEIIRMKGFNNIPSNYLTTQVVKDITPSRIYLMNNITSHLAALGFDEVRSWVLIDQKNNELTNYINWDVVRVTNSINEEVPFLRQSIAVSLLGQAQNYQKNNINPIQLFEIGKIFGKRDSNYLEVNSLGLLINNKDINLLKDKLESLLRNLGLEKIEYQLDQNPPKSAHPLSCWQIRINNTVSGIIYITNTHAFLESCVAEVNLDIVDQLKNEIKSDSSKEVTQKIVDLDANIVLDTHQDINSFVLNKVDAVEQNLWAWQIIDEYKTNENIKYTIRVSYVNLTDPEAKELHAKLFNV